MFNIYAKLDGQIAMNKLTQLKKSCSYDKSMKTYFLVQLKHTTQQLNTRNYLHAIRAWAHKQVKWRM